MLYDLLPHMVNGLALGLLFALLALGFMLIIGVMEVINLAHGSLFALGAYMGLGVHGARRRPAVRVHGAVLRAAGGHLDTSSR